MADILYRVLFHSSIDTNVNKFNFFKKPFFFLESMVQFNWKRGDFGDF